MRHIYKYPLTRSARAQAVEMPPGAVLHVAIQHDTPTVWAAVDADAPTSPRTFCIFGTGEMVADHWHHVGTLFDGPFVWHVFEMGVSA